MASNEMMRLRKIQKKAHEIMDEVNFRNEQRHPETLLTIIDNLSRAVGDLSDPTGSYSLEYLEDKVGKAHSLMFKKKLKMS